MGNVSWPQLLPRPTPPKTISPAPEVAGLVTILLFFRQQAYLWGTSFLRGSPAKANKPAPSNVSVAGSGTELGSELIEPPRFGALRKLEPKSPPICAVVLYTPDGIAVDRPKLVARLAFRVPVIFPSVMSKFGPTENIVALVKSSVKRAEVGDD